MRPSHRLLVLSIPLVLTRQALGQANGGSPPPTNAEVFRSVLDSLEKRVLDIAEAMPAEKYSFAPKAGAFAGPRTFGEQLEHVAADLYLDAGTILEEHGVGDIGSGEGGLFPVRTKPQIIACLRDAFAYMRRASATIDDANELVLGPSGAPYGPPRNARLLIAIANIGHLNDHVGELVEYLRMNGIIPPKVAKMSGRMSSSWVRGEVRWHLNRALQTASRVGRTSRLSTALAEHDTSPAMNPACGAWNV